MSLQFNPGPYLDAWQRQNQIQDQNRIDPNTAISQPILQGLQQMADAKRQQQLIDLQKQTLDATQQKNAYEYGTPIDPNATVGSSTGQTGSSVFMPGAPAPGTAGPTPAKPVGTGMKLVDAFNAWRAGGMKGPALPDFMGALGKDERTALFKEQNPTNPKPPETFTLDQYSALASGDPKRIAAAFPTGVPKDAASLGSAFASKASDQATKGSNQQDKLEGEAINRVTSIRGDASLKSAEEKRDAAITVYNTINNLKTQGRMPSALEYYDLLGQMWKARTGAAPTDQAIRDLDQRTFKGNLGKAVTYITGQPAGATTADVLNNIQSFAEDSGRQADKFHQAYMDAHLIKPTGLDDSRWQNIVQTHRGTSFSDATGYKGPSQMVTFIDSDGQQHSIPSENLGRARQRDPGLRVVSQ